MRQAVGIAIAFLIASPALADEAPVAKQFTVKAGRTELASFGKDVMSVTVVSADPTIATGRFTDGRVEIKGVKVGRTSLTVSGVVRGIDAGISTGEDPNKPFSWRYLVEVAPATAKCFDAAHREIRSLMEFVIERHKDAERTWPAKYSQEGSTYLASDLRSRVKVQTARTEELDKALAQYKKGAITEEAYVRRAFDLARDTIADAWKLDLDRTVNEVGQLQAEWDRESNRIDTESRMGKQVTELQELERKGKNVERARKDLARAFAEETLALHKRVREKHDALARSLATQRRIQVKEAERLVAIATGCKWKEQIKLSEVFTYSQFEMRLAKKAKALSAKFPNASWPSFSALDYYATEQRVLQLTTGATLVNEFPEAVRPKTENLMMWVFEDESVDSIRAGKRPTSTSPDPPEPGVLVLLPEPPPPAPSPSPEEPGLPLPPGGFPPPR